MLMMSARFLYDDYLTLVNVSRHPSLSVLLGSLGSVTVSCTQIFFKYHGHDKVYQAMQSSALREQ